MKTKQYFQTLGEYVLGSLIFGAVPTYGAHQHKSLHLIKPTLIRHHSNNSAFNSS